jgi:tRNA pseudouridine55 synthase
VDGFLCINKPRGPSSFQIVKSVFKFFGLKSGHAGTLDPAASGLLVVAIGKATRLLQYLPGEPKTYRFAIQFGSETDTLDTEGNLIKSGGIIPSQNSVEKILSHFIGEQKQIPPVFSAIKVNGRRAYKSAREGLQPEMKARSINIYSLVLNEYEIATGTAHFTVECSGGTYVRSLARDIAAALGTFGFAAYVHRLSAGNLSLENALCIDKIDEAEKYIIPIGNVFRNQPKILISESQRKQIGFGQTLHISQNQIPENDLLFAFDQDGELAAVLKRKQDGGYHPATVLLNGPQNSIKNEDNRL